MDEALLGDSVASSFLGGLCGSAIGRETEGMHNARILALRGPLERSAFFMRHELDADERDTSGQESIPHQDDPWQLCSTGMQRIDLAMLFQVLLAKAWLVLDHPPQVREVADHVLKTIPAAWPEYEDLRQISLDVAGNDAYFSRDRTWDAPLGWFFATTLGERIESLRGPPRSLAPRLSAWCKQP